MTSEGADAQEPAEPTVEEHRDDGLDLAKAARRSAGNNPAAGSARTPRRTPRLGRSPRPSTSGAHPDDRDPQLLGSTLNRFIAQHGWEVDLKVQSVFGRWGDLVGEEVAAHTTPESFADSRLVVRTDSTAWATQLKLLAPAIVRRLNEELGHGTVSAIEILGPHLPSWKKGRYGVRNARGPRDTYG